MDPLRPLNAQDRCDRCGAQAYYRTKHESEELLWCGHHWRENEKALSPNLVFYQAPAPKETAST